MNSKNIKMICEYIFDAEEENFKNELQGVHERGTITIDEMNDILVRIEAGTISCEGIRDPLNRINHVYASAMLVYENVFQIK